ncbi:MAG: sensor histidine kinase [Ideonella sp. MAG2]|nr:MAG: sensor histidine kinase [Ideonella sp. MAG2]
MREPRDFQHSTLFDDLQQVLQAVSSRGSSRGAAPLPWCGTGPLIRALLLVLTTVYIGLLFAQPSVAAWLLSLPMAALVAIPAVLMWLALACLARHLLAAWSPLLQWLVVGSTGALCAMLALLFTQALDLWQATALQPLAVALTGAGMAVAIYQVERLRERARLPMVATARLADLQTRIRPHFLFNTLNTAIALVQLDPQRAEEVLEDLAELFRAALGALDQATTLGAEVSLTQRYIAIEQLRFGSRLEVDWQLDPQASAARLPPLTLQPLIENAVRHGVEPSDKGGVIEVRTLRRRDRVMISITNTRPTNPSRPGHGIGLASVKERLRLMHDLDADFRSGVIEDGRWRVSLSVPAAT